METWHLEPPLPLGSCWTLRSPRGDLFAGACIRWIASWGAAFVGLLVIVVGTVSTWLLFEPRVLPGLGWDLGAFVVAVEWIVQGGSPPFQAAPGKGLGMGLMLFSSLLGGGALAWLLAPRPILLVSRDPAGSEPLFCLRGEPLGLFRKGYRMVDPEGKSLGLIQRARFSLGAPRWRLEGEEGLRVQADGKPRPWAFFGRMGCAALLFGLLGLFPGVRAVVLSRPVFLAVPLLGFCGSFLLAALAGKRVLYTGFRLRDPEGRDAGSLVPGGNLLRLRYGMSLAPGLLDDRQAAALGLVLSLDAG